MTDMALRDQKPVLLCIDLQLGFLHEDHWGGDRNNKNAEAIASAIIEKWRALGLDVVHVRHSSTDPKSPLHESQEGFGFMPDALPKDNETVITKSVNSGFIGTNLKDVLDDKSCDTLVIIGLTTDHCVSTTTRMAGNMGYETYLISDATATFARTGINGEHYEAETIHTTALASLHNEFATVTNAEALFKIL